MAGIETLINWFTAIAALLAAGPVALIARYMLAAVFGLAGQYKLRHPQAAASAMVSFGVASRARRLHGIAVGAVELGIGLGLLIDAVSAVVALVAAAATLVFLGLIGIALYRGHRFPCGCFSSAQDNISGWTMFRGIALVILAIDTAATSWFTIVPTDWLARYWSGTYAISTLAVILLATTAVAIRRHNRAFEDSVDWEWVVQEHPLLRQQVTQ